MSIKIAPLNSAFMLSSILGLLISIFWVAPNSETWGIAFGLVFLIMFISSIVSMTYGPVEAEMKMDGKYRKKYI